MHAFGILPDVDRGRIEWQALGRRVHGHLATTGRPLAVHIAPEPLPDSQRRRFHAICGAIAKSHLQFGGKYRTAADWKVLLISAHAAETRGHQSEVLEGLAGELIDVRESTTSLDAERGASLIAFATAWAESHGVVTGKPEDRR